MNLNIIYIVTIILLTNCSNVKNDVVDKDSQLINYQKLIDENFDEDIYNMVHDTLISWMQDSSKKYYSNYSEDIIKLDSLMLFNKDYDKGMMFFSIQYNGQSSNHDATQFLIVRVESNNNPKVDGQKPPYTIYWRKNNENKPYSFEQLKQMTYYDIESLGIIANGAISHKRVEEIIENWYN